MDRSGSLRRQEDEEGNNGGAEFTRKRSLIRPERSRIEPGHRQYHYTQLAAQQSGRINVLPSTTGNDPVLQEGMNIPLTDMPREDAIHEEEEPHDTITPAAPATAPVNDSYDSETDLKGGRNVYGLNDEVDHYHPYDPEPYGPQNLNVNAPGATAPLEPYPRSATPGQQQKKNTLPAAEEGVSLWHAYCKVVTFWAPGALLSLFGMKDKGRQMAWREKIGLITVICYVAAFVAYLTFGFTKTVCDNNVVRKRNGEVSDQMYVIINGRFYDLSKSHHPAAMGIESGANILYPPVAAGGMDASFMFQNVNGHCKGLITPKPDCSIPHNGDELAWYMPCQMFAQNGTTQPNFTTNHYNGYACHTSKKGRDAYYSLRDTTSYGEVYFTWEDVKNSSRQLVVYNGNVLDLALIDWIQSDDLEYPSEFDRMRDDTSLKGIDVSQYMTHGRDAQVIKCLSEIAMVGYVDTEQIGCLASQVVLYVSLVFIIGIVAVKFCFALYYRWVVSLRQGAFYMDRKQAEEHQQQIEDWSNDIYTQGPIQRAANPPRRAAADRSSKFIKKSNRDTVHSVTMGSQMGVSSTSKLVPGGSIYNHGNNSRGSFMMLNNDTYADQSIMSADTSYRGAGLSGPGDENNSMYMDGDYDMSNMMADYVVPQPPPGYQPFGFPLAHTICLVTAYSESIEGLRTTLDSVATTDYPNSHKLILIVCDGIIKGSGNDLSTPEVALSMMKDFAEPPEEVQAFSYVSVVSGSKRHNMAKVYAGFYKYDDETMDPSRQQRVPMMVIVKCGTPAEADAAKPGNRGKRDSQIILMSFLQRVMFDERMTELEYEIFNGIWKITGVAPDFYEIVLMVDADTKVFPDSLTHMVAQMVKDPDIMGLCGETKIANKTQSWVTAIQVFEYFISHHQAKAFESVFGGVTCLPGCFCMYRIKTPKGADGYWVPILANPDIVERYADNVVDTLHKKNLLLLGEDRFLSTLMLRTFPKRKQVFVSKAACKTVVPDEFKVLLSQRRRWINSTVHNLFELVLVRDLCGTFCISMQFVVFIDLVSTLVLPAAITFTLYVVVIAIVSTPTPVMSLVLLGLILGLPGILVVVTAHRFSYVLWMLVYLIALPIWNFVLPMYAYWKFDDFSWGDTRKLSGAKDKGHDDVEGEFDSSQIVMRRWRDFERERRRVIPQQMPMGEGTGSMISSTYNPHHTMTRAGSDSSDEFQRTEDVL